MQALKGRDIPAQGNALGNAGTLEPTVLGGVVLHPCALLYTAETAGAKAHLKRTGATAKSQITKSEIADVSVPP